MAPDASKYLVACYFSRMNDPSRCGWIVVDDFWWATRIMLLKSFKRKMGRDLGPACGCDLSVFRED
jgi:hypothetical protein